MGKSLGASIAALGRGVVKRFLYWVPFILLDATDYWDRYFNPFLQSLTGRNISLPSDFLILGSVGGVTWSAILTYHQLRKEKIALDEELAPTVEVDSNALRQEWMAKNDVRWTLFYVAIHNPAATAVRNVSVYLTEITPAATDLSWLPIPLHLKHDNQPPYRDSFDMNPRSTRHVDLISYSGGPKFRIEHVLSGVNHEIPVAKYLLKLRIEGANITFRPRLNSW